MEADAQLAHRAALTPTRLEILMHLDGVLFFPVSPFDEAGQLASTVLEQHVAQGLSHEPGGVFVACGTGEMHALDATEFARAVKVATSTVAGATPVCAGVGGPLPVAVDLARRAEENGADGLLLLPPYLVGGPSEGTLAYVEAVAGATDLAIIVYQRGGAVFTPETAARAATLPNVVGFKDGLGDLELMHSIVLRVRRDIGDGFMFFNGLPTAELTAPAYRGIGVSLYSSAAYCFVPEVAVAFQQGLQKSDETTTQRLLTEFFMPLVQLRNRVPGYAVSLVKTGVRLRGLDVGGVRAPLLDPTPEHQTELSGLIERGLSIVGET